MRRFEYQVLEIGSAQSLERRLNNAGSQGWELVAVNIEAAEYIFKREAADSPATDSGIGTRHAELPTDRGESIVVLAAPGKDRIAVMKVLREQLSIELPEAKRLVESTPIVLANDVSRRAAAVLRAKLAEVGADVQVK